MIDGAKLIGRHGFDRGLDYGDPPGGIVERRIVARQPGREGIDLDRGNPAIRKPGR